MLVRLSLVLVIAFASFAPATAAQPAIANYFMGTWSCDSAAGAQGAKVFGLTDGGQRLILANPFVSAKLQFGQFNQTFVQDDRGITVNQHAGPTVYTASSQGWNGDTLAFTGTLVNGAQTTPERETFHRAGADRFTQNFATATSDAGPWKTVSQSNCLRIKAGAQIARISGDASATALQKLATHMAGPSPAQIYVGKLPDDWKAPAPLPSGATLVGSVERGSAMQMYYDFGAGNATLSDYTAQLKSSGFAASDALSPGGFTPPNLPAIYCAAGKPAVSVTQPSGPDRSFSVTLTDANPLCNAQGPLGIIQTLRGPLPSLVETENATMTGSPLPFRMGATSAKIVSKAPLSNLIESFASQMVAGKWQRLDSSTGAHTATASFTRTDEHGVPWEAVITIYAAPGIANTYYSLVDTMNLNGETLPGGSSTIPTPVRPDSL